MREAIDGIFYASNVATRDRMDSADFARIQKRFYLPIL